MQIDFVIALYQEDAKVLEMLRSFIDSLVPLNYKFHIYLYTKAPLSPQNSAHVSRFMRTEITVNSLPNNGRESDTYLYHMMRMCAMGKDTGYTVFLQGRPFDHAADVFHTVRRFLEASKDISYKPNTYIGIGHVFCCNLTGYPNHPGLPILDVAGKLGLKMIVDQDEIVQFVAGAQFLTANHLVTKKGFEYFNNALNVLYDFKMPTANPINGFVFERLWQLILRP